MYKGFREGTCWRNRSLKGPSEVPQHLPLHFCCLPRKKLFPAQGTNFSSGTSKKYTLIGSFFVGFWAKNLQTAIIFCIFALALKSNAGEALKNAKL